MTLQPVKVMTEPGEDSLLLNTIGPQMLKMRQSRSDKKKPGLLDDSTVALKEEPEESGQRMLGENY